MIVINLGTSARLRVHSRCSITLLGIIHYRCNYTLVELYETASRSRHVSFRALDDSIIALNDVHSLELLLHIFV